MAEPDARHALPWFTPVVGVARLTFVETAKDPGSWLVLAAFAAIILFSPAFALFSFGQEARLVREMGVASLRLFAAVMACAFGARVIPMDRESGTQDSLLIRPLTPTGYLVGRFLGLAGAFLAAGVPLGLVLLGSLAAGGSGIGDPGTLAAALGAAYVEGAVLLAVALASSTRLPAVPAGVVTAFVFLGGHILPALEERWPAPLARALDVFLPCFGAISFDREAGLMTPVAAGDVASVLGAGGLYVALYLALGALLLDRSRS